MTTDREAWRREIPRSSCHCGLDDRGRREHRREESSIPRRSSRSTSGARKGAGGKSAQPASIARLYPERIGNVRHYYAAARAAVVRLESGELHVGDTIHIRGHTTDFYQRIEALEIDDRSVEIARAGQTVGIQISQIVRENDGIFLLSD